MVPAAARISAECVPREREKHFTFVFQARVGLLDGMFNANLLPMSVNKAAAGKPAGHVWADRQWSA